MPGEKDRKLANLRAAYGFWMTHPGKKLLFMGQDFAQEREWSEKTPLDWELLEEKEHKQMQDYVKALLSFIRIIRRSMNMMILLTALNGLII